MSHNFCWTPVNKDERVAVLGWIFGLSIPLRGQVQVVASPTSTVTFDRTGLPAHTVVERILWLLEGIGLRVSTEDTGKEVQSIIAALKAA